MFFNLSEKEEEKLVNGWFYNFRPEPKDYKHRDREFSVRYCQNCKKSWQYYWSGQKNKFTEYYLDFPKYRLEKQICDKCNKKLNIENESY